MMNKSVYLLLGATLALTVGGQGANAATRQVGTCTTNPLQYTTIQSAVNAAHNRDTIQICPGTYPEQVVVTTTITLTNVPSMADPVVAIPAGGAVQNATLLPPYNTYPVAAQVLVSPSAPGKVNVKNLIVDGTGNNDTNCGMELIGIYYQNAGGVIQSDTAQNQLLPPGYQGCQDGEGIFVENQTVNTPPINISGNTVINFDKNGITVSYGAADATISNNIVTGLGPTDVIAQNGIQLGYEATGAIKGNQVSDLVYTPGTYGSSGILLYDTESGVYLKKPSVSGNTVTNAQYGVVLDAVNGASGALVPILSNTVSGAQFAGVGLYSDSYVGVSDDYINVASNVISGTGPYDNIDVCSDNNTISRNTVSNSAEGGIHLDALCQEPDSSNTGIGNTVTLNQIDTNCVGVLSGPLQGQNTIKTNNSFSGNTNNYIYGQDSYSCGPDRRNNGKGHNPGTPAAPLRPLVR